MVQGERRGRRAAERHGVVLTAVQVPLPPANLYGWSLAPCWSPAVVSGCIFTGPLTLEPPGPHRHCEDLTKQLRGPTDKAAQGTEGKWHQWQRAGRPGRKTIIIKPTTCYFPTSCQAGALCTIHAHIFLRGRSCHEPCLQNQGTARSRDSQLDGGSTSLLPVSPTAPNSFSKHRLSLPCEWFCFLKQ